MTDIREKLIELIGHVQDEGVDYSEVVFALKVPNEKLADHLLANDVTVQQFGRWKYYHRQNKAVCTVCSFERDLSVNFGRAIRCPNCGANMEWRKEQR